jgi:hypothetical protein
MASKSSTIRQPLTLLPLEPNSSAVNRYASTPPNFNLKARDTVVCERSSPFCSPAIRVTCSTPKKSKNLPVSSQKSLEDSPRLPTKTPNSLPFNFFGQSLTHLREEVEEKIGYSLSSPDGLAYLLLAQQNMLCNLNETVKQHGKVISSQQACGMFFCHLLLVLK